MDVSLDVAYDVEGAALPEPDHSQGQLLTSRLDRHPRPGQAALPYRVPQAESLLGADCVEKLENRRELRKSRKYSASAIPAAARLCNFDTRASYHFTPKLDRVDIALTS